MQSAIEASVGSTPSVTVIPLILTSDKTHLSGSGKTKGWPVYMTIGNIAHTVRFSPKHQAARLVALLPTMTGNDFSVCANIAGLAKHESNEQYRKWNREMFHTILYKTLQPLEHAMNHGIRLPCGDGHERLCFPVLCEYIADMEEQWLLGNLIRDSCPKCLAPRLDLEHYRSLNVSASQLRSASPRRDTDATKARVDFQEGRITETELREGSYHENHVFSANYRWGGIMDAMCPDLLHQVSKCFKDYAMDKWVVKLIKLTHCGKNGVAEKDVLQELDSRFILIPGYKRLHRFKYGVFTQTHFWTVKEYKEIMKVIMGVISGICPTAGVDLAREWLHIHRLSHYPVHTDESADLLRDSIHTFWKVLKDPHGPFLTQPDGEPLVPRANYATTKTHVMAHYPDHIRKKGILIACSTDRTEPWHKPLKRFYLRSNKGADWEVQVLRAESRYCAFESYIDSFLREELLSNDDLDKPAVADHGKATPRECAPIMEDLEDLEDVEVEEQQLVVPAAGSTNNATTDAQSDPVPPPTTSLAFCKLKRKGWPMSASTTENILKLDGFAHQLELHFRRTLLPESSLPTRKRKHTRVNSHSSDASGISVTVYDSLTITYSTRTIYGAEISGSAAEEWKEPQESQRLQVGLKVSLRRDCVLVNCPEKQSRSRKENSMTSKRVARVLLLFKALPPDDQPDSDTEVRLAYVQWFQTVGDADAHNGMYQLKRTKSCSVIEVGRIAKVVHLIPKFGRKIGDAWEVHCSIQKRNAEIRCDMRNDSELNHRGNVAADSEAVETDSPVRFVDVFDYYEDFWLNNWIDLHTYNSIF
jgi:Plavaka transposase